MKQRTSKSVALLTTVLLVMGMAGVGVAAEKWIKLGDRVVNDRLDHDSIDVGVAQETFTALKIKVLKRAVHFKDVKVHFANGGVQDIEVRRVIGPGGETRVLDLTGGSRAIDRVEFWYEAETPRRGRKAKIRLFGRR